MILLKSGVLDLKTLGPTWLLMSQREYNTWTKSKNQWFHHSNGLQSKVFFVSRTLEVWDSTLWIVNSTLMPFTEVEAKSCQLPEDFTTPLSYSVDQPYSNQSSVATLPPQVTAWVVSIKLLTPEEVKLSNKSKYLVLLLTW